MKILFLSKFSEVENHLIKLTESIGDKIQAEIDLLHVVNSYPQVPLKIDGTIIDNCVDYDLSELFEIKKEEENNAESFKNEHSYVNKREVLIGQLDRIVKHKLREESYDLILMGSHKTSLIEDLTHESTIYRILEVSNIPVLTLKDIENFPSKINRIGIFDDFSDNDFCQNIVMKSICKAFDCEVFLYKVNSNRSRKDNDLVEEKMKQFSETDEISTCDKTVVPLESLSDEKVIMDHIESENLDMIVISDFHKHTFSWLFRRSMKENVADHVTVPTLII